MEEIDKKIATIKSLLQSNKAVFHTSHRQSEGRKTVENSPSLSPKDTHKWSSLHIVSHKNYAEVFKEVDSKNKEIQRLRENQENLLREMEMNRRHEISRGQFAVNQEILDLKGRNEKLTDEVQNLKNQNNILKRRLQNSWAENEHSKSNKRIVHRRVNSLEFKNNQDSKILEQVLGLLKVDKEDIVHKIKTLASYKADNKFTKKIIELVTDKHSSKAREKSSNSRKSKKNIKTLRKKSSNK